VALFMERSEPRLEGRLIAAVQLTRPSSAPESPALVRALVAQTETLTSTTNFARHVSFAPFMRAVVVSGIVTTTAVVVFLSTRPTSEVVLRRAFLSTAAVPHETTVICTTGHQIVAKGQPVTLAAIATGRVPTTGSVALQFASGRRQTVALTRDGDRFARQLDNVQESFRYTVQLGDGISGTFRIDVQPPPTLAAFQCTQHFPAYTKLPPVPRRLGDLSLLAGSRLQLTARTTKPIRAATLQLVGLEQSIAMSVTGENITAEISIPTTGLTGLRMQLVDAVGLRSAAEPTYPVDVLPDRPPEIRINLPTRREEMLTAVALLTIGFAAVDDYGVARVFLQTRINNKLTTTEFDLKNESPRSLQRRYEWSLAEIKPPLEAGTIIEYWLEARDNNDRTGPGVTATEHYFARVVTAAEKRAELLGRLDDSLRLLLNSTQEQDKLNRNLGDLIRGKQSTP
jgi:hypothetical protein